MPRTRQQKPFSPADIDLMARITCLSRATIEKHVRDAGIPITPRVGKRKSITGPQVGNPRIRNGRRNELYLQWAMGV